MADENLKGQGNEVPTGGEGLPDTAHNAGGGAAPASPQTTAAGPTAGAGAAGQGRKAALRGKLVTLRARGVLLDPLNAMAMAVNARILEGHAPELMRKLIDGEMTFRQATRALADRPAGPPVGDPKRVTDALANALELAEMLERVLGLEKAEYICRVTCGILLRRYLARLSAEAAEAATGEGGEPLGHKSAGPAGRPDTA
jgi:hypothetical protein